MTREQKLAVCDILKYIQKQPQAKHTAEGIANYWIHQQRLEEKIQVVLAAIDYLVDERFLLKIEKDDREFFYCVNSDRLSDIAEAIRKLQDKPDSEINF